MAKVRCNPAYLSSAVRNLQSRLLRKRRLFIVQMMAWSLLLAMLAIPAAAQMPTPPDAEKTLSPFFFVRSDNPAVDRLPLLSTAADVSIAGVIADVAVTQTYKNDGAHPIEALYVFPASTRAAVYGMKMTIGNRTVVAEIHEREQARQIYEVAKQAGKSASLLEQQRPNVFQMNVANIMPGDIILIELRYTELLVPHDGVYEFVYPTVVGPRYSNKSAAGTPASGHYVASPYQHEGETPLSTFGMRVRLVAGVPIQEIDCPSHKTRTSYNDGDAVTVELMPEETNGGNRDFILRYRLDGGGILTGLLLAPGIDENFFLLMVQPPRRVEVSNVPPREYILIMDVSGSMNGFPIETSKALLRNLLGQLRPVDSFNVLFFSGGNWMLSPQSLPASPENIQSALDQVSKQQGGGVTELLPALRTALGLQRTDGMSRTIVIATDGFVDVEAEAFDLIRDNLGDANLFAFGIGTNVNRHLIEGLAHAGMGEPFVVTNQVEAEASATRFLQYIASPVLTQVRLEYEGFNAYDVEPRAVPDMFSQRPIIAFGKWRGEARGAITVTGRTSEGTFYERMDLENAISSPWGAALRFLWARHRIQALADNGDWRNQYASRLGSRPEIGKQHVQEVTQLGLKYNLLTPYTSFVAVDHVVRGDEPPEKVQQPLPMPKGVTDNAVGSLPQLNSSIEASAEVNMQSENLLLESSSSAGVVVPESRVTDLPMVNSNVFSLVKVMGGVTMTENPIFGAADTQFAGVSASNINVQRDGITVNDVRFSTGLNSPVYLNPEMVGEFKMVIAPVDAEMGRGNGQVQVVTRSGSNSFHGSAVWNNQNTALDAQEWYDNLRDVPKDWRNQNEYTLSLGGPIIKNKTFFFASWDHQLSRLRQNNVNLQVLTPCARKSIFRWFDGWSGGNILTVNTKDPWGINTTATVNADGTPKLNLVNPTQIDGSISQLRQISVLGKLLQTPNSDCSNVTLDAFGKPTSDWVDYAQPYDSLRTFDATGYMKQSIDYMPLPNNYQVGDGLNYGGYRWVRHLNGGDNIYGLAEGPNRKQINFRIDHNFNARHRISGTYSYERDNGEDAFAQLPSNNVNGTGGFGGVILRRPQNFSINFTSTLRPTLLNEIRFGMTRTASYAYNPLDNPDTGTKLKSKLNSMFSTGTDVPVIIGIGNPGFAIAGGVNVFGSGRGNMAATWGGHDPRWTYGDTITWTRGKHSMKLGGEMQRSQSHQTIDGAISSGTGALVQPSVRGNVVWSGYGANSGLTSDYAGVISADPAVMPGAVGGYRFGFALGNVVSGAYNLMNIMAGSVSSIDQYRFISSPRDLTYNNIVNGKNRRIIDYRENQFSLFAKDDWKLNESFTLNLGVRYEFYGIPYLQRGLTAGLKGGALSIFGRSGKSFSDWMKPGTMNSDGSVTYKGTDAELAFIGPESPNPDQQIYNDDYNNFGPAIGFAWQLPWFGTGKTTIRGGYQLTYMPPERADIAINYMPGFTYQASYTPNSATPYLNLSSLRQYLPIVPIPSYVQTPAANPVLSVRQRSAGITVYDPNLRTPYVQNLTLSVVRNLSTNWTLDVRYIGTLSRKQSGLFDLNSPNIWNNGLKEAFDAARKGDDSNPAVQLLDRMFAGVNIAGSKYSYANSYGPVGTTFNGVLQTGAMHLRAYSGTAGDLANGNYIAVARTLATMNYDTTITGNSGLPAVGSDERGTILRLNGFPENFIYTSPQFGAANWIGNLNHSNYHSLQTQITLRPTHGFNFSGTYTWSRNLSMLNTTDPRNRAADYGVNGMNRAHQIAVNGTLELPLGPDHSLFRNAGGVVSRLVSGWTVAWIANFATGRPFGFSSTSTTLYGAGTPNRVGDFDAKSGYVYWAPGARTGHYWWDSSIHDDRYALVRDPQCTDGSVTSLQGLNGSMVCGLMAVALNSSTARYQQDGKDHYQYIFVNPVPTQRGNFQQNSLSQPAIWSADMMLDKSVRIGEGKTLQFRIDATNVFNHGQPSAGAWQSGVVRVRVPGAPVASMGYYSDATDGTYAQRAPGYLSSKVGARTWQAKIRFDF
jgi:Ca-activated chloride channel homolog